MNILSEKYVAYARIVIGGPSNSGKSTFAVVFRDALNLSNIHTFHRDLDPFSPTREYALKKISNQERILKKRIITEEEARKHATEFKTIGSEYDLVIGDLPGTTEKTTSILAGGGTHAIILCSDQKQNEKKDWLTLFNKIKIPVICILESNLTGNESISDGHPIQGTLSNLDRDHPPEPSDAMRGLAELIGKKLSKIP